MLSPLERPRHNVLGVRHGVENVVAAARFLVETLGFELRAAVAQGAVVDNGALTITLFSSSPAAHRLEVELVTPDLDSSLPHLDRQPGVTALGDLEEVAPGRFERHYDAPHGLRLVLVRQLSPDEMGLPHEVPTSLAWERTAIELVREVLRFVPEAFRPAALRRTAERAEVLTLTAGEVEVQVEHAIQAMLDVTPAFQQERLHSELTNLGIELTSSGLLPRREP